MRALTSCRGRQVQLASDRNIDSVLSEFVEYASEVRLGFRVFGATWLEGRCP